MTHTQPSLIRWCVGLPSLSKYNAEWMAIGEGLGRVEEIYATFQSLRTCHIWVLSALFQEGGTRRGETDVGELTQRVQTRIAKLRELGVEVSLEVGTSPEKVRRLKDTMAKARKGHQASGLPMGDGDSLKASPVGPDLKMKRVLRYLIQSVSWM